MIQFNLLPDVKLDFIKAQRAKRNVMTISILVSLASAAVLGMMFFTVNVLQKQHLQNLKADTDKLTKQLESNVKLNKILTIQNQMASLDLLHAEKPETSRLFAYLAALEPSYEGLDIKYDTIEVDFLESTISVKGLINTSFDFNNLVDTYKFAEYAVDGEKVGRAFSNVVTEQSAENKNDEPRIVFEITAEFDPAIFDNTQNVDLVIDNKITTRSILNKPEFRPEFEEIIDDTEEGN